MALIKEKWYPCKKNENNHQSSKDRNRNNKQGGQSEKVHNNYAQQQWNSNNIQYKHFSPDNNRTTRSHNDSNKRAATHTELNQQRWPMELPQQRHKNDLGPSVTTPAITRSTNMSTLSPTRSIDIDDNKNNENNSGNNIIGNNHEGRKLQYQHRQQEDKPEPSRTPTAWSIQARQNCHYIQLLRRSASHHWHPTTPQPVGQIIPWYIESWSIKW